MEKEIYKVPCIDNGISREATIELIEKEELVIISVSIGNLLITEEGENYFETMIKVREKLEKVNKKLLCKACSKNVYPSGMQLSMGTGRIAYTLTIGEQAKMESVVDIFSTCTIDEFATIKEQLLFFIEWSGSIRRQ